MSLDALHEEESLNSYGCLLYSKQNLEQLIDAREDVPIGQVENIKDN